MSSLIYIHGFLSSPRSHKALQMQQWLAEHYPEIHYFCPFLSAYPDTAQAQLEELVEQKLADGPVYLVGSSMGGFWSTYLAEKYGLRAVLINPAVEPSALLPQYLGKTLNNYHTDDSYVLGPEHIEALQQATATMATLHKPENYWLLVQTGDETLDYRLAVEKYQACKQTLEVGGDHSFQNFERHIAAAIEFLQA